MHTNKLIGGNACPSWACLAPLELLGQHQLFELTGGLTTFYHLVVQDVGLELERISRARAIPGGILPFYEPILPK